MNARHIGELEPGDIYQLYQTLVGAWPMTLAADDAKGLAAFRDRVTHRQRKALREAKLSSSWSAPDKAYERAARRFLEVVLDPLRSVAFLRDLHGYAETIAPAGAVNGLVQALLRCTAPGMPDLYQGAEGWDLSLVDPDNRRPVDFKALQRGLATDAPVGILLAGWRDGRIKQRVIATALNLRRRRPELFARGGYQPLDPRGSEAAARLVFYARIDSRGGAMVIAPLCSSGSLRDDSLVFAPATFAGVTLDVPAAWRGRDARNLLTGETFRLENVLDAPTILASAPLALIEV